jgi:hypothetical protein
MGPIVAHSGTAYASRDRVMHMTARGPDEIVSRLLSAAHHFDFASSVVS